MTAPRPTGSATLWSSPRTTSRTPCDVDASNLVRTFRFLASTGTAYEDDSGRFHLTAAAERLVREAIIVLTESMFTAADLTLKRVISTATCNFMAIREVVFRLDSAITAERQVTP